MSLPEPRRGEVWLADLDKVRPVVVLTRDPMGSLLRAVVVAPVTTTIRGLSTEVPLGAADGLRLPSVANCDNIQLVDRTRFERRVGQVRPVIAGELCDAVATAIGCS